MNKVNFNQIKHGLERAPARQSRESSVVLTLVSSPVTTRSPRAQDVLTAPDQCLRRGVMKPRRELTGTKSLPQRLLETQPHPGVSALGAAFPAGRPDPAAPPKSHSCLQLVLLILQLLPPSLTTTAQHTPGAARPTQGSTHCTLQAGKAQRTGRRLAARFPGPRQASIPRALWSTHRSTASSATSSAETLVCPKPCQALFSPHLPSHLTAPGKLE